MSKKKLVEQITSRDEDFAKWYTDLCLRAELMDYSDAKGFIIYRPYGYAIWENIQQFLDKEFKRTGHENVYLPLLIPQSLFQKEKDHVEGFAPEVATVTTTGIEKLNEPLVIRPTSEVLFATHYAKIINSWRDLPKKYNQWCSVVRWEKTTRPFLRGKEFLWQEGHTVHDNEQEAREEVMQMIEIYRSLGKDLLAIPFVLGRKTEREKFAGAIETYSIEALMYDGQALQSGTSHYFGQGFAKAFDIKFRDKNNEDEFGYQTSWGVSTRLIGAIIMVHADDEGLVLPPYVAPTQVMVLPLQIKNEEVMEKANEVYEGLLASNIRAKMDDSNRQAGWKFSEYDMKGVPIRLELGARDLANGEVTVYTRYNQERTLIKLENVNEFIVEQLQHIHANMYEKAVKRVEEQTRVAKTYDEFKEYVKLGGYIKMSISGEEAEVQIKNETTATARIIVDEPLVTDICPVTGDKATQTILFARAY